MITPAAPHPRNVSTPDTVEWDLENYTRWCIRYGQATGTEEIYAAEQALQASRQLRASTGAAIWDSMILLWEMTLGRYGRENP